VDPYTSVMRPGWSSFIATAYRTCVRYASRLLELVDRLRPVVLQQARQRPVGQETAPGLAGGAVVRLVVGVDDPLHRRSAPWARLAVLAVHRHVGPERRHLLRPPPPHLGPQLLGPAGQAVLDGPVEPLQLLFCHRPDRKSTRLNSSHVKI